MLAALRMHLGLSERLLSAKKLFQYLHMIAVTTRVNDDHTSHPLRICCLVNHDHVNTEHTETRSDAVSTRNCDPGLQD